MRDEGYAGAFAVFYLIAYLAGIGLCWLVNRVCKRPVLNSAWMGVAGVVALAAFLEWATWSALHADSRSGLLSPEQRGEIFGKPIGPAVFVLLVALGVHLLNRKRGGTSNVGGETLADDDGQRPAR